MTPSKTTTDRGSGEKSHLASQVKLALKVASERQYKMNARIVAAGLSDAQKRALLRMPRSTGDESAWGSPWKAVGLPLVDMGLVDYSGRSPRGRLIRGLTLLGLEVRAAIINKQEQ